MTRSKNINITSKRCVHGTSGVVESDAADTVAKLRARPSDTQSANKHTSVSAHAGSTKMQLRSSHEVSESASLSKHSAMLLPCKVSAGRIVTDVYTVHNGIPVFVSRPVDAVTSELPSVSSHSTPSTAR